MNNNPLQGYFRTPSIHMTLPSGGIFYAPGSLDMPTTGELPVYPMSYIDEISYKTPDALFNGSGFVSVVKSCIPGIIDPWQISSIDVTAILANIRIASKGHNMEVDTECPKCNELTTYTIDLRNVVDNIHSPDYATPLMFGDLQIFFKPLTYKQVNENNKNNFKDQQIQRTLSDDTLSEDDKMKAITTAYNSIMNHTLSTIVNSIGLIKTPEADVSESEYIADFLKHCDNSIVTAIKDRIVSERDLTEIKPMKIICDNEKCKHEYEQPFTLDMSDFFE